MIKRRQQQAKQLKQNNLYPRDFEALLINRIITELSTQKFTPLHHTRFDRLINVTEPSEFRGCGKLQFETLINPRVCTTRSVKKLTPRPYLRQNQP